MKLQKIKKYSSLKTNEAKKLMKLKARAGFTLVETLVAITILTVSIAGPITIASKGLASAMFARDQITAFYLAQEAVEFVRNKRDENVIKGSNWLAGLGTCLNGTSCIIDVTNNNVNNCPGDVCPLLEYNSSTGSYNYSGSNNSIFTRKVKMTEIFADKEVSITVTLSWRTGIVQKTFVVKEYIFNWQ